MQPEQLILKESAPIRSPNLPPGFEFFPDFISMDEEIELIQNIKKLEWKDIHMHGVVAHRKVVHFGLDYKYNQRSVKPTEEAPVFLQTLMSKVARLLKIPKTEIAEILVTAYPAGAGIGWHRDALVFGNAIVGVSLLSPCTLKFRRQIQDGFEIVKIKIPQRSAYLFSGEARWTWQHSIASHPTPRYSLTFRTLGGKRA